MALHWNVSACAEQATTKEGWVLTEALIWSTIFIGINKITEKNVEEFYGRLATYEQMFSPLTYRASGDHAEKNYTTYAELRHRIGLSTNASAKTRKQFLKNLTMLMSDQLERNIRDLRSEKEAA